MTKKKPIPAMYPKPEPTQLAHPQKIVAVEIKRGKLVGITIEGAPPAELLQAVETERERFDLIARLRAYKATLLARIEPHCGERPKHIPPAKWRDIDQRIRLIAEMPKDAPAEARDALLALQTLFVLSDALIVLRDMTPAIKQAVCAAIDLGMLLQRGQTQIDHGEAVDVGRRNVRSRANANSAKSEAAQQRFKLAESEYHRRMKDGSKKTATLKSMSKVKDHNGKPVFGSFGQLKRDVKSFKSLTPSE